MSNEFKSVRTILYTLFVTIILLSYDDLVFAAPGDLDPTFGSGGKVTTDLGTIRDEVRAVAVQPNGKIVAVGVTPVGNFFDFALVRYNANGSIDTTFGTGGKVTTAFGTNTDEANAVALQPDGKIVAAGYTRINGIEYFAVARYNTDGSLDTSFDTDGKLTTAFGTSIDRAQAVAIQPNGKIVVVGRAAIGNGLFDFALARYNEDGSLDTSFDTDGKVTTPFGTNNDEAFAVALQADGKIVAAGRAFISGKYSVVLARYNPDGSLDTAFDTDGKVTTNFGLGGFDAAYAVALQPDGKIIAAGTVQIGTMFTDFGLARYNADGSLDTSFDGDGKVTTALGTADEEAFGVTVQPNGKIVACGYSQSSPNFISDFALVRYNADGSLDTGFDGDGKVITDFGTSNDRAFAVALQPDGKIVAAGFAHIGNTDDFALARYNGDPVAIRRTPFDFDGDGKADISVFRPSDRVWYLNNSTSGFFAAQFGLSSDEIVPADFDGDGRTDISVFREGIWYWLASSNGSFNAVQFGQAGDIPVSADYTGDGRAEPAVYRAGVWHTLNLADNQSQAVQFGISTDKPVPADFDGDGKTDFAIYRDGVWWMLRSTAGVGVVQFGIASDTPTVGDYDGDGQADQAVYRDGIWYVLGSTQGFYAVQFGIASDIPVAADYDGDGKTDFAVYRDGVWWMLRSQQGVGVVQFGLSDDQPIPAAYVP